MNRRQFASVPAVLMLPGCGNGIDVAEWNEEVLLHDGRKVLVWRRARAYSSGFPNASRGANIDMELKFDPLGIGWMSKANRVPISFELFDGVAHLVNYITDRETCAKMKPTDYTAQFLRWQDGQWVELAQTAFPVDRALLNLSEHFWGHTTKEDYRGTVSWEEKRLMGQRSPTDTIKSYFERSQRFCGDYLKI